MDSYGTPLKGDWVTRVAFPIQTLLTFATVAIVTFLILRCTAEIYRLPNFKMLFHLVLTNFLKKKLFLLIFTESCLRDQLIQKAYRNPTSVISHFKVICFSNKHLNGNEFDKIMLN